MNAIAAVDENWGIGRNGKLLVRLPGDLKHFKEKTLGKTVVMGRETYDSIGNPLPGRETVVLSRDPGFKPACKAFCSLADALEYLGGKNSEDVFVAGGQAIYEEFFEYCDRFFITKIFAAFEADRHFPNLDENPDKYAIAWSSGIVGENSVKYQFIEYVRNKK
ncbi:MAG: dihydrofolate reductase [Clostridiales bacterium]|nr:dihydrofolate reductase [Clostridiales bacterium]